MYIHIYVYVYIYIYMYKYIGVARGLERVIERDQKVTDVPKGV
jgi:hypothetical protein